MAAMGHYRSDDSTIGEYYYEPTAATLYSMLYDAGGNRQRYYANGTHPGETAFGYSGKDELTGETSTRTGAAYSFSHAYDLAGNPTTLRGTSGITYNANNQRDGYTYDGNGNPTAYKGKTLAYDVENRLSNYGGLLWAGYRGDGLRAYKQDANGVRRY
jgi:hypothetical protein